MNLGICKTHGRIEFTEPNKNGLSFCLRCLALSIVRAPSAFALTLSFYRKLKKYLPIEIKGVRILPDP